MEGRISERDDIPSVVEWHVDGSRRLAPLALGLVQIQTKSYINPCPAQFEPYASFVPPTTSTPQSPWSFLGIEQRLRSSSLFSPTKNPRTTPLTSRRRRFGALFAFAFVSCFSTWGGRHCQQACIPNQSLDITHLRREISSILPR